MDNKIKKYYDILWETYLNIKNQEISSYEDPRVLSFYEGKSQGLIEAIDTLKSMFDLGEYEE